MVYFSPCQLIVSEKGFSELRIESDTNDERVSWVTVIASDIGTFGVRYLTLDLCSTIATNPLAWTGSQAKDLR
jgi:hypothetical protein